MPSTIIIAIVKTDNGYRQLTISDRSLTIGESRYELTYIVRVEASIKGRAKVFDAESSLTSEIPVGTVEITLLGGLKFSFETLSPLEFSERLVLHVNRVLKKTGKPVLRLTKSGRLSSIYERSA